MNSTAVVIPNWNGINEIKGCLDSLLAQTLPVTIIVVDNGSVDGSVDFIQQNYPTVTILAEPKNLGFAGGVNRGIRYALEHGFGYIALFNSDAVADQKWAEKLASSLVTNPVAAIATGLLLHGDGKTIDSTGDWYTNWGLPFPRGRNNAAAAADPAGYVFSASGGASMYRASLFNEIGLFDETFFAYYEDVDISFRTQLAGYKIIYNPEAVAYHKRGVASNKIPGFTVYQAFKNLPLLLLKNVPGPLLLPIGARFCLAYLLVFGNTIVHGNGWPALKGWGKSIVLAPGALKLRRSIQKNKKVGAEYIDQLIMHDLPPDQTGLRKFRKIFTGKP